MKLRFLTGLCAALTVMSVIAFAVLNLMRVEAGWYLGGPALVFWGLTVTLGMLARPGYVPHRGCIGGEEEL